MAIFFRAEHISKEFGGTQALSDVTLEVRQGEVHALVGENGAGKSTLSRIISGDIRMTKGSLIIDDRRNRMKDCLDARHKGIYMVYQELRLFPSLTVAENLMLYRYPRDSAGLINWKQLQKEACEVVDDWGLAIDVGATLGALPLAQQQLVEILKNLSMNPRILIMDEPTSSLGYKEVDVLFRIIKDMKQRGMSIIYISHIFDEVFKISDRVSVLRDGKNQGTFMTSETNPRGIIEAMLSERSTLMNGETHKRLPSTEELLRVEHLSRTGVLHDISFSLNKGEIIGITGLLGAGKTEVGRSIFGLDKIDGGKMYLNGRGINFHTVGDAMQAGIAFIPEDRRREGLFHMLDIKENITFTVLHRIRRFGLINRKKQKEAAEELGKKLHIKYYSLNQSANDLSGGNQQKIVIAKWLLANPCILIADEPTRGIDVGTKREISDLLKQIAGQGMGIILLSEEADEILDLSDRILVMRNGSIECSFSRGDIDKARLVECVTGADRDFSCRTIKG